MISDFRRLVATAPCRWRHQAARFGREPSRPLHKLPACALATSKVDQRQIVTRLLAGAGVYAWGGRRLRVAALLVTVCVGFLLSVVAARGTAISYMLI